MVVKSRSFFRDEDGITTVSMAICIFLSLALIFSAAQLYRIESASAEIQEVADVAAQAAENEVAEFMIVANTCDALVLSLTLLAMAIYGMAVVTACIPPLEALSIELASLATRITNARNTFATNAASGLDKLQKLLPFLSAANAARVSSANNQGAMDARYYALSVLVPLQGKPIQVDADSLDNIAGKVESDIGDIRDKSNQAEEKAKEANQAKHDGYMADCGNNPSYCMYERTANLSQVGGSSNPYYASEDAWSFSVALKRASFYYHSRMNSENAFMDSSLDVESRGDSAVRLLFYTYANEKVGDAYTKSLASEKAVFPQLFKNTNELRQTPELYDKNAFPVTGEEGSLTMHAWPGCPNASSYSRKGSVRELEGGGFTTCELCKFVPSSLGNVASASTNISNGFEHHYEKVRLASEAYNEAMDEMAPLKSEVQDKAGSIFDSIGDVLSSMGGKRINVEPPGSAGAIALVVNTAQNPADTGFESSFIDGNATLGVRAAVSGATLVADTSDSASSVITSLLDGFGQNGGAFVGAGRIALDCWSTILRVYEDGQSALTGAIRDGLNAISSNTASGLGSWAKECLDSVISSAGLEAAKLDALKPVIINTGHIASADSGSFAVRFKSVKQTALSASASATDPFSSAVAGIESALSSAGLLGNEITIATIDFPVGDMTIPIKLTLPEHMSNAVSGFVHESLQNVKSAVSSIAGERSWQ